MRISGIPMKSLYLLKVAFEESVLDDVKAFKEQMGKGPFNAKHGLSWDLTYRNISAAAATLGMVVVEAKRGFWEFDLALDLKSKEILVFMKEPNTNISARTDYHYFNALLYKHESFEIDMLADDFAEGEDKIKMDIVKEILGEFADVYDTVLVMSKEMDGHKALKTSLKLYSKEGQLLETELIPNLPNDDDTESQYTPDQHDIKGISLKDSKPKEDTMFDSEDLKRDENIEDEEQA